MTLDQVKQLQAQIGMCMEVADRMGLDHMKDALQNSMLMSSDYEGLIRQVQGFARNIGEDHLTPSNGKGVTVTNYNTNQETGGNQVTNNVRKDEWHVEGLLWRMAADNTGFVISTSDHAKTSFGDPVPNCIAVHIFGPDGVRDFGPFWDELDRLRRERRNAERSEMKKLIYGADLEHAGSAMDKCRSGDGIPDYELKAGLKVLEVVIPALVEMNRTGIYSLTISDLRQRQRTMEGFLQARKRGD